MAPGSRIRVGLIRGSALNPFDAQQYGEGRDGVEMIGIGSRRPAYPLELLQMPVRTAWAFGDLMPRRLVSRVARHETVLGSPDTLIGLRWAVRDCRILHVAETFIVTSAQAAVLRRRSSRQRLIVTVWENIPFQHEDNAALSERKRLVRSAADGFVAVTQQAREVLRVEGVPDSKIVVRPAAVDDVRFSPARRRADSCQSYGVPEGGRVLLYVGRLIAEKGVIDLVMALAELPADVHLVCVGDGDQRSRLDAAARLLGVSSRVHIVGGVSYAEIPALMASCDALGVPSLTAPYWTEQFGMVLAEGMCCGAPIVAYASGAIPEVVGDGAALCPPGDRRALAAKLRRLLGQPDEAEQLRKRARAIGSERYAAAEAQQWWSRYYNDIWGGREMHSSSFPGQRAAGKRGQQPQ
jgi:glycosyltransferase involved in cell wall biosynthesis